MKKNVALVAGLSLVAGCMHFGGGGETSFVYVQWNMGHFAMGKNSRTTVKPEQSKERAAEYREFMKELDADVIGISEFENDFDTAKTPSRTAVFADYPNLIVGPANSWQWNALASRKFKFESSSVHDYKERFQKVYWIDAVTKIDGKEVHFVQSHLDWNCDGDCVSHRHRQIEELIAAFRDKPYVVISADFNIYYDFEWEPFKKAGFDLAVCGKFGPLATYKAIDAWSPRSKGIDNVIVKGFSIDDVKIMDQDVKLSDHCVVRTRLTMLPPVAKAPLPPTHEQSVVPGEAPSLLPAGEWKLAWHDEFTGNKLDATKWGYRTTFWGRDAHWFAKPWDNAVEVTNGLCRLKVVKKGEGKFVSPQLQTGELVWDKVGLNTDKNSFWPFPPRKVPRFEHRYGYYECRCKLQKMPGWWSAFWMQSPTTGASLDPETSGIEQDIMESFVPGEVVTHCFHMNGYGSEYRGFNTHHQAKDHVKSPAHRLSLDEFHRFGLLWEEDGYTTYVDGVPCGEKVGGASYEAVSKIPEFILITTECQSYRGNGCKGKAAPELEAAAAAGDAFEVDYVRVFDRVK